MTEIHIPGYEILEELGHGGMASVFRAHHIKLDRDLAIKVMDSSLNTDPSFAERFKREARISARLSHPHIVLVYDVNSVNNINYLAMEYISKGDLHRIIHNPLSPELLYQLALQIGNALDYANNHGIVHRDVKPSNILIRENGSFVLADFGIARAAESYTQMTLAGSVIGTPSYMSPEQAQGHNLDGRADLYSLGIVCFEILTKELPYKAKSSVSAAIKHLSDPIPTLGGEMSVYQPFFNKAMAKRPEDRFQTGAALAEALGQLLDLPQEQTVITSKPKNRRGDHPATPPGNYDRDTPSPPWEAEKRAYRPRQQTPAAPAMAPGRGHGYTEPPSHSNIAPGDKTEKADSEARAGYAKPAGSNRIPWGRIAAGVFTVTIGAITATWYFLSPEIKLSAIAAIEEIMAGDQTDQLVLLLGQAKAAYDKGNIYQPKGASAYHYYEQVIAIEPGNAKAKYALQEILYDTVSKANTLIETKQFNAARIELDNAALIDASNLYLLVVIKNLDQAILSQQRATNSKESKTVPPISPADPPADEAIKSDRVQPEPENDTQTQSQDNETIPESDPMSQPELQTPGISELLQQGKTSENAGDYASAMKSYLKAYEIEPGNTEVDTSLHQVAASYTAAIQTLMDDKEIEEARKLHTEALVWFPNSEVLAGLAKDIDAANQESASSLKTAAREAPEKPEDFPGDPDTGKSYTFSDQDDIVLLFEQADELMAANIYFSPEGNSAYDAYKRILEIEPGNKSANSGITQITYALVEQVNNGISSGNIEAAKTDLGSLKQIGANTMAIEMLSKKIQRKERQLAAKNDRL